jgi:rod shape-determining protein MreD
MSRARSTTILFWFSIVLAVLLSLVPLPSMLQPLRPFWLALMVIYWALEEPERMPLGLAFTLGLALDALSMNLLGESALRLAVLDFILLRFRSRMRFFPMPQQALAVLALLTNDRVLLIMMRAFSVPVTLSPSLLLAPLAGTLLWPWLFLLLDEMRQRARPREA